MSSYNQACYYCANLFLVQQGIIVFPKSILCTIAHFFSCTSLVIIACKFFFSTNRIISRLTFVCFVVIVVHPLPLKYTGFHFFSFPYTFVTEIVIGHVCFVVSFRIFGTLRRTPLLDFLDKEHFIT
jgi:hypothetical protein